MKPPCALIQLISEQTMQNLVPLLALHPAKVFHLSTPRSAARSAHISEAASLGGVNPETENIRLSEMPSIPETSRAVLRAVAGAREAGLEPVINFTGGTKLMSIGAYEAAMREHVFSFYVDTDHQQFIDGHTGATLSSVLGQDTSFTSLQKTLSVSMVALANGRERVSEGLDWKPYLELVQHLLAHPDQETETWNAMHGRSGLCPGGREPRQPAEWLPLFSLPIALPPSVGDLAAMAGLVDGVSGVYTLPSVIRARLDGLCDQSPDSGADAFAVMRSLQFICAFLSGAWWEVAVLDGAERSGQFHDLRWSVQVGQRQSHFQVEEDIVAVDGPRIAYFSCKRGGTRSRLVPALDELDARARAIGGNFTRRFFAVYLPPTGVTAASLRRRAMELRGIQILTRENIYSPEAFSRL